MQRFGIDTHARDRAGILAQGQRKILDIAMATACKPDLLFFDEPTSGVSSDEKMPIMDTLLGAVAQHNTTVLFIEHDMEIIARYASRVVAFYEGAVLADGPADRILDDPRVRRHVIGGAKRHPAERSRC